MPFGALASHRRIVGLLARSVARDALPPSLLFTGPARGPMRETAIALAQALNCLTPVDRDGGRDACGTCSACVRIARRLHPDVLVLEPGETGSIKIEQVRDAIERTAYRPFEGRTRAVIVDEADALVPQAQNALLKTLEEPPSSSIFVLLSTLPELLLPTVRSRVIRLRFPEGQDDGLDDDARAVGERVLARVAESADPGRRLEAAQDLLAGTGRNQSGAADRELVSARVQAIAALIRDVQVIATGADPALLAHAAGRPAVERLVPAFRRERGARAFAVTEEAVAALAGNAGVKTLADWVVLHL